MQPDEIIEELVHMFRDYTEPALREWNRMRSQRDASEHTRGWTKIVKQGICRLGRQLGFLVRASGVNQNFVDAGEWLYDVTWREVDEENNLNSVPLVAECEWGYHEDIMKDFEKLPVARATVRLMVYTHGHLQGIGEHPLEVVVERFDGADHDAYLLIACHGNDDAWHFSYRTRLAGEWGDI